MTLNRKYARKKRRWNKVREEAGHKHLPPMTVKAQASPWMHCAYLGPFHLPWKRTGYSIDIEGEGATEALSRNGVEYMVRDYMAVKYNGFPEDYLVEIEWL